MIEAVRPLEEIDPEFAQEVLLVANKKHPSVQSIIGDNIIPKPIALDKVGRNDPCKCGSGKKFKKCCGRS
jgi:uncharacterized protein YecA (UPF0149 family)